MFATAMAIAIKVCEVTTYPDFPLRGKLEGKIEGVQEKALEVAKTMLAKGFDSSLIAEITQLSITAIEDLRI